MAEFSYEIKESFATLSDKNGWTKEFNLVSYNGREPSYDIRSWHTDEETGEKKMSKGITLNKEEMKKLIEVLEDIEV